MVIQGKTRTEVIRENMSKCDVDEKMISDIGGRMKVKKRMAVSPIAWDRRKGVENEKTN